MTHVNQTEIEKVKKLIEVLQMRQSLLSETTLVSEDALCSICYAQQIGMTRNEFLTLAKFAHHLLFHFRRYFSALSSSIVSCLHYSTSHECSVVLLLQNTHFKCRST